MIVNCLPLYELPPARDEEKISDADSHPDDATEPQPGATKHEEVDSRSKKSPERKSFSLIRARSAETLDSVAAELELHDQDYRDYKSEDESCSRSVALTPRKWSRLSAAFSKNMTVMVHNQREDGRIDSLGSGRDTGGKKQAESNGAETDVKEANTEDASEFRERAMGEKEDDVLKENFKEKEEKDSKEKSGKDDGGEDIVKAKSLPTLLEPDAKMPSDHTVKMRTESIRSRKQQLRSVKSSSPIDADGSEGETDQLTVNYLDINTMSTLKRSSGSVSFYYRTEPVGGARMEAGIKDSKKTKDDDSVIKLPLVEETVEFLAQENTTPSAPPASASTPINALPTPATPTLTSSLVPMVPSVLPAPIPTLDMEYIERSGWLNKLSHRKGMFGDKWQKRYFVLHRSWLYYFKKYGVSVVIYAIISLVAS